MYIVKNNQQKEQYDVIADAHTQGPSLNNLNLMFGYLPDIYYIIPDAYANSEVLEEFFEYNNNEFVSYLENKGFVIVEDSTSAYPNTLLSLPTTLNMEYADILDPNLLHSSLAVRRSLLEYNKSVSLLRSLGYAYIAISSDNTTFSGEAADHRFNPNLLFRLLIRPTIFDPFSQRFRNRVLGAFDAFNGASRIAGPKFVLAHIISPHDPYVFGPDGENIGIHFHDDAERSLNSMRLYLGQLQFTSKKLEGAVEVILKNSSRPPIIIIQSDHGFFLPDSYDLQTIKDARFKNFSAYLIPKVIGSVSDSIAFPKNNINTFRFIFNQYFGAEFDMMENKTIWAQ